MTVHLEETVEVVQISSVTLVTRLSNNKQTKRNYKVSCQTESLHNGVIAGCNIDDDGSSKYSIQFKRTVRGRHELTVLIDGQHVAGSPFPVYVFIHPTQLGKPVKVWNGIDGPHGITANSKGDILVIEKLRNIINFDANGLRHKLVAQKKLKALRCIAIDDEDNICCIDQVCNKILTCDKMVGRGTGAVCD